MGKSKSAKMDVTNYYMSLHFGLTCGPSDAILGLYANEKTMWEGNLTTAGEISINQPELFGGVKKEGGTVGSAYYLPGGSTQVMPEALAAKLGRTSATCPAYRGISTVFFYGGSTQLYNPLLPFYFTTAGFLWSSNNPIIAQTVWAKLRRAPKGLDPDKALIGPDANPAHMVFECLTNTDWGLGLSSTLIDGDSFSEAADTLYAEGFGLSMIWTQQAQVEDFVSEILDHIQANYYINPRTGLYTLKLIRDDYDPSALRVITPDNADLTSFQRKMWGETANEIVVTWTNPVNEQEETVSVQNLAVVSAQGGPVPDSRNYYGVRNKELAVRLANRDLVVASAPLATVEVELDRTAWDLLPGEVVKVTWPEYDLDQLIMRVGTVDYGKIGDPTIRATLLEDVFSLEKPTDVSPPDSGWTRPGEPPAPMAHVKLLTLPYFFVSSTDLQAGVLDLDYPSEVVALVLAHQTGYDTPAYELLSEQVSTTGATTFQTAGTKATIDRITLSNSMAAAVQSTLPGNDVANVIIGPQVGGFVFIGDTNDAGMEIALVDSYDGFDWILARGVLDTVPRDWPAGTPMWFVNSGSRIVDDQTVRAPGESPDYKLLSRTSLGILAEADAPVVTGTMTARPHLPLRPANVRVRVGTFAGPITGFGSIASAGGNIQISWATRNRTLEDGQVVRWNASTVAPEYAQETVVSIYDQGGALVYEQGSLWTETSLTLPASNFDRYSSIKILVRSRRDGLWSLQGHSIQVTGLANNPAAPLPPAPPPVTQPPAPTGAPGSGVFTVTGTAITSASGASTPTVLVVGTPDNNDATGLVIRYHKTGSTDYSYWPTVDLRPGTLMRVPIAPLAALTDYVFEAAYEVGNNPLGGWRTLLPNPVTTGAFVADNAVNIGTRTAVQLLADVDEALATALAALAAAGGEGADLSAAIAAAQAARDAAQAAQAAAETARDEAEDAYTAADAAADLATTQANLAASKATEAGNSATAAAGSASTATTKATEAGSSATSASASANTASTKATEAAGSATAASTSASGAAVSQTAAGNSASAAQTAKVAAETAATNAANSASAAATSASSAASSNTAAGANASAAQTSATNAATSASNANTYASQASTSATNASGSASTAATQATNAANSATAAGGSASAASGSASVATTKATEAGNSATSASTSANTASTQAAAAATSASAASSSAAAATSSAAAAQSSAVLSASVGAGGLPKNPVFADYPNATGIPPQWLNFSNATAQTSRVAGQVSPNAAVAYANPSQEVVMFSEFQTSYGWYVVEADITLVAGTLVGAGIQFSSGGSTQLLRFNTDLDINEFVQGAGSVGTTYRFRKLVQISDASTTARLYAMTAYAALGSVATARTITWHRCNVRPASGGEIAGRRADSNAAAALAQITTNAAAQASVNSAQATTNTSLQSQITTANGNITTNAAAISAEASTRATQTAALAATDTTLTSTVNGHTATLTTQAATLADVTGKVYSRYVMEATAGGVVTGIYAVSSQGSAGIPISGIKFRANTFAIVPSDDSATMYPFVYDATLGTLVGNNLIMQSANIGLLAVKTLNVDGEAITTEKLKQNAVTNSVSILGATGGDINVSGTQTINSGSIAIVSGRVEVSLCLMSEQGGKAAFAVRLFRNGSLIFAGAVYRTYIYVSTVNFYVPIASSLNIPITDFPGPGTHTYTLQFERVDNQGSGIALIYNYMNITEIKR